MRSRKISSIWSICGILLTAVLLFTTVGYGSNTYNVVLPHPGSNLASAVAEIKSLSDSCSSWDEDLIMSDCTQPPIYRSTWGVGCYSLACPIAGYGGTLVWQGPLYVSDRVERSIYTAYGTCSRAGQSIRIVCLGPGWDAQYDNTTWYVPDTSEITDKNQGGQSCASPVPAAFVGNPVNAATGNKYEPVTDLTLSTPGIPLEFKRFYNSAVIANGPLGSGWTHSFSMNAQTVTTWTISGVPTPVRVRIIDADGRALYFSKIFQTYSDGHHFYGESGVKDRLIINTSGQYILRKKDNNLTYTFDSTGKLQSVTDANSNTLTLTYTGSQLMQVTSNFGAALTFVYTGSHISSVTDPKGQAISYTYTRSDLTQVTYPDTNSVSYAYDTNHRLTDKKDTAGNCHRSLGL